MPFTVSKKLLNFNCDHLSYLWANCSLFFVLAPGVIKIKSYLFFLAEILNRSFELQYYLNWHSFTKIITVDGYYDKFEECFQQQEIWKTGTILNWQLQNQSQAYFTLNYIVRYRMILTERWHLFGTSCNCPWLAHFS